MRSGFLSAIIGSVFFMLVHANLAAEPMEYALEISNHRFNPNVLRVPAGKKFKLIIKNLDATPEEFESYELNREKIVAGNSKITIFIGPLKPGAYKFFGEFNASTAQGEIIAK